MKSVYLLRSMKDATKTYIGVTKDVPHRLSEHNQGKSTYTSKYVPWQLVVSVNFVDNAKALALEKYLKSGSGHAFAQKHLF